MEPNEKTVLSGALSHNALAATVQMYHSVIADYERQLQIARATVQALKDEIETRGARIKEVEMDRAVHVTGLMATNERLTQRLADATSKLSSLNAEDEDE